MQLLQRTNEITVWTPAKLNLFLEVLGKRADGFHEIETLITAVSLYDTLRFTATTSSELNFSTRWCTGTRPDLRAPVPTGNENLVVRALELLLAYRAEQQGAQIELIKRIPVAAGMGGASSDAAAALVAGNVGWKLGLRLDELLSLAAQLGSDVPFFLSSSPAVCRGRGERITRFASCQPSHYVIIKPCVGLSTADVYHNCHVPAQPRSLDATIPAVFNRLQAAAFTLSDDLRRIRNCFQQVDVPHHQLTGSGSAYFGVCRSRRHAIRVAARLRQVGADHVWIAQSHPGFGGRFTCN